MRKLIIFIIIIIMTVGNVYAQTINPLQPPKTFTTLDGYTDGVIRAQDRNVGGSIIGGFVCGVLTGVIGTVILWAATNGDDVPPQYALQNKEKGDDYSFGFQMGYKEKTKDIKKGARVGGALLGTLAVIAIYLSDQDSE